MAVVDDADDVIDHVTAGTGLPGVIKLRTCPLQLSAPRIVVIDEFVGLFYSYFLIIFLLVKVLNDTLFRF